MPFMHLQAEVGMCTLHTRFPYQNCMFLVGSDKRQQFGLHVLVHSSKDPVLNPFKLICYKGGVNPQGRTCCVLTSTSNVWDKM